MHYHRTFFPVVTLACCFAPTLHPALAAESFQAQQWEITADKLTRIEHPASILAEGNVILTKIEKITKQKKIGKQNKNWDDLLGEEAGSPASAAENDAADSVPSAEEAVATSKSVPEIADDAGGSSEGEKLEPSSKENREESDKTVTKAMTTVKANWMLYDMEQGTVKMREAVFVKIGSDQLTADAGMVNLKQETGSFENASIVRQYKDMHFEGRVIEKTGELTYRIEDGWIITCKLKDGETPPWSFKAAETDISDGGYAYLKHATFRIKDVPILYTPIMILPAKRNRQTGFLFPLASLSSRNGFGLELPFFINLSPSSDITLYPHYIMNRGLMSGAEMRYVLDQESKGTVMGNMLSDELSNPSDPDGAEYYADSGYTHTNQERYWFRGKADQEFGEWTARLDLDVLSDRDYLTEFDSGRTGLSMSDKYFLEQFGRGLQDKTVDQRTNTASALRSWGNGTSLRASFQGINDIREESESTVSPLWKLPELKYSGLVPVSDTGMDLSWNTDYVNYWREKGVSAQRIDLYPKLTRNVPILEQYLDMTVGTGVRDTMYAIDDNGVEEWQDRDTENRFLGTFESEVATTLKKDFGDEEGWSHTLRPFVKYNYVTEGDQDDIPQFDAVDSFGDQNKITYGVNNFFHSFGLRNKKEFEREQGYVKLQQSYDIRSEAGDKPFSAAQLRTAWYPVQNLTFKYETDLSVYDDGFVKHVAEGDYLNGRGDVFSLDYIFRKNEGSEDVSSLKLSTKIGLVYNFSAGYSLEKSLENSVTVQEKIRLIYHPSCWSVELGAETTPDNEQVTIMFQLANIGAPFGFDLMGAQ